MTAHDAQYQETTIEEVCDDGDRYLLRHRGSWVVSCPKVVGLPAPVVGETMRLYGSGNEVRGIVIDGRVYHYRTASEELAWSQFERITASAAVVN